MSAPERLSDRQKIVHDVIVDGRIGDPEQVACDVITALYHAGWLRDRSEHPKNREQS